MKPILIITPYFAPQTHAAMFRVHKLVKYLPQHGYKPIVLTTDINYLYNENSELLKELPECVEIIRSRHIEPSLRGLRMALGGKDRTFVATKKNSDTSIKILSPLIEQKSGLVKRALSSWYSSTVRFFYNIPDAHWTWTMASQKTAEKLIRDHNIKLLYTTANPYSHLGLAASLKEKFDLKWLADFRDPCGYGRKHSPLNNFGRGIQDKILSRVMKDADIVTGLAETYGLIFADYYGLPGSKYQFIPTGLDDDYLPKKKNEQFSKHILFVGEVMPEQGDYIFQVLKRLRENGEDFFLSFIGRAEINKPIIDRLVNAIPDWPLTINFIDHIPQKELYENLISAKAVILAPGSSNYWWNNFAKMVDYIALRVPVIADVPVLSEARKELERAELGFFLERDSVEQDADRLHQWLKTIDRTNSGNEYWKRYLASSQVSDFARLFDKLSKVSE